MSKRINTDDILNSVSKIGNMAETIEAKDKFKLTYIPIEKLRKNPKNFYELTNIEELEEEIEVEGLNSNLLVRPMPGEEDVYELIGGHRRYTALTRLVEKGLNRFRVVPCKVVNVNDLDAEILLINDNANNREISPYEKKEQVKRLDFLYNEKKKRGEKIPGRIRERIAKDLNMSPAQVGRYQTINNKLIPELQLLIKDEKLTIENASFFAALPEENQRDILKLLNENIEINRATAQEMVKKIKAENNQVQKQLEVANLEKKNIEKNNNDLKLKIQKYENEIQEHKEKEKKIEAEIKEKLKEELTKENEETLNSLREELKLEKEKSDKLSKKIEDEKLNDSRPSNVDEALKIEDIKINTQIELTLKDLLGNIKPIKNKVNNINLKEARISNQNKELYKEVYKEYLKLTKALEKKLELLEQNKKCADE